MIKNALLQETLLNFQNENFSLFETILLKHAVVIQAFKNEQFDEFITEFKLIFVLYKRLLKFLKK